MEYQEIKMLIRANARLAKGLVNLLKVDTEQMCIDADAMDVFGLNKSIRDTKKTAQILIDTMGELERDLYLIKRDA